MHDYQQNSPAIAVGMPDDTKMKSKDEVIVGTSAIGEATPLIPDSPISGYGDFLTRRYRSKEPRDYLGIVHIMFFLQGLGLLLPWSMFITAGSYFHERLLGTPYADSAMSYITSSMLTCQILFTIKDMCRKHTASPKSRILVSFGTLFCVFVLSCSLVHSADVISPMQFFALLIGSCAISGAATAVLQNGLFGLAGMMPAEYMRSFMIGQGMGGVFVSLTNVGTLIGQWAVTTSAFAYFLTACVVLILTTAIYLLLTRHPYVRYHVGTHTAVDKSGDVVDFDYWRTFTAIYPQMLNVFLTFTVTIAVFPGLASRVHPVSMATEGAGLAGDSLWGRVQARLLGDLFVPVCIFVNYNVSDYVGRVLTTFMPWPRVDRLWILVFLRVLFIPALGMCNVQPVSSSLLPDWFAHSNVYPIMLVSALAISGGFCGSVGMVYGSHNVTKPRDQECAGVLSSMSLSLGLLAGSLLSFVL